jgi:hypothetical protein
LVQSGGRFLWRGGKTCETTAIRGTDRARQQWRMHLRAAVRPEKGCANSRAAAPPPTEVAGLWGKSSGGRTSPCTVTPHEDAGMREGADGMMQQAVQGSPSSDAGTAKSPCRVRRPAGNKLAAGRWCLVPRDEAESLHTSSNPLLPPKRACRQTERRNVQPID